MLTTIREILELQKTRRRLLIKRLSSRWRPANGFKGLLLICCLVLGSTVTALELPLPIEGDDLVGYITEAVVERGETIADTARRYNMSARDMTKANPRIRANKILRKGMTLMVPSRFILPPGPREGIIINLAELRLYYFPKDRPVVITEPVGIGKEDGWETPLGVTKVVQKEEDPAWHPTDNVRAEAARNGTPIPKIFPPGPDNPLGQHVLRLGWNSYLIHGTNHPEGVGDRVSAGCIRMFPEGVAALFEDVPIGTSVRIIDEPYKIGWRDKELYFESHPPLKESKSRYEENLERVVLAVKDKIAGQQAFVRWVDIQKAVQDYNGMPQVVGVKS